MMRNPLKKFGLKVKDHNKNYIYSTLAFGDVDEMLREAKYLNRRVKKLKLNDRRYFVWPVAGPINHAILVLGKTTQFYPPIVHR